MILFRCNASPTLGVGHLMRCRSLAMAIRDSGEPCIMVGPPPDYRVPADDGLFDEWVPCVEWQTEREDAHRVIAIARERDVRGIVVDDYRVREDYQAEISASGIPWLQFDYKADRPLWADIVVNANPAAPSMDYARRSRNPYSKLLLGPRYAVLRPEFPPADIPLRDENIRRILVTFGGGDDRGAILFVLRVLLSCTRNDVELVIMSGANNPRNRELEQWVERFGRNRTNLMIEPENVARVFASCDMAVMSAGTSTFEAASCGLPLVLISIAENQELQATAWETIGAAKYAGSFPGTEVEYLNTHVKTIVERAELRHEMSMTAQRLVDGTGAKTVAELFLERCLRG